eukprot:XP_011538749.1 uncharacterized protein LOC105378479 [Homo sapiens]
MGGPGSAHPSGHSEASIHVEGRGKERMKVEEEGDRVRGGAGGLGTEGVSQEGPLVPSSDSIWMPAVDPSSTRHRPTLPSSQPQLQEEEGLIPTLELRTLSSGKTLGWSLAKLLAPWFFFLLSLHHSPAPPHQADLSQGPCITPGRSFFICTQHGLALTPSCPPGRSSGSNSNTGSSNFQPKERFLPRKCALGDETTSGAEFRQFSRGCLSRGHSSCLQRGPYGEHLRSRQQLAPTCQPSGKKTLQPQSSLQMAVALADVSTATS